MVSACANADARSAALLRTAPRGRPVVPEVKTIAAPRPTLGLPTVAGAGVRAPPLSRQTQAPAIAIARSRSARVHRGWISTNETRSSSSARRLTTVSGPVPPTTATTGASSSSSRGRSASRVRSARFASSTQPTSWPPSTSAGPRASHPAARTESASLSAGPPARCRSTGARRTGGAGGRSPRAPG